MRHLTLPLALLACLWLPAQAADAPASAQDALVALDQSWGTASSRADVATLDHMLADEFTVVEADGSRLDKQHYLAAVKAAGAQTATGKSHDFELHVYGELAVMRHLTDLTVHKDGKDVGVQHQDMHVFIHRDGRWQVLASQVTTVRR